MVLGVSPESELLVMERMCCKAQSFQTEGLWTQGEAWLECKGCTAAAGHPGCFSERGFAIFNQWGVFYVISKRSMECLKMLHCAPA